MQRQEGTVIEAQTQSDPGKVESFGILYPFISEYCWTMGDKVTFEKIHHHFNGNEIEIAVNLAKDQQFNSTKFKGITHKEGHVTNIDPGLTYQPGYITREIEIKGSPQSFYIEENAASGVDLRLHLVSGKNVYHHVNGSIGSASIITVISNVDPH